MNQKKSFKDLTDMFSTTDNTEPQKQVKKPAAKRLQKAKSSNRSSKKTKIAVEPRSQRKQFLFTKTDSTNLKVLAMTKKTSVNELVNEAVQAYIKKEFKKNPEAKSIASKLIELENE